MFSYSFCVLRIPFLKSGFEHRFSSVGVALGLTAISLAKYLKIRFSLCMKNTTMTQRDNRAQRRISGRWTTLSPGLFTFK